MTRDLHVEHQGPDLLDFLADHGPGHDVTCCDHRAGYLNGLRRAATYVQDYGHDLTPQQRTRLQAPLLHAIEVAQCGDCNPLGCVVRDDGRHVEHHPAGGH